MKKLKKQHLEAINHAHPFDYIVDLFKKPQSITLLDIYSIHRRILLDIYNANVGELRKGLVSITGLNKMLDHQDPTIYVVSHQAES